MTQDPTISLIVATARNGVIGNANTLPWRMPSDLALFRSLTWGKAIIMGRKTWESIGKPLPGRVSFIVSSSSGSTRGSSTIELDSWVKPDYEERIQWTNSLPSAISAAQSHPLVENKTEIMIIGGAQIYAAALPLANRIYRTLIDADVEGDAFFAEFKDQFQIISSSAWQQGEKDQFPFRTEIWERA